ncbi:hypothetical protein ACHAW5_004327 [Stephanodiscus triporus]|uniref:TLDc domain-containing protein n=1 Tax=Stephanodiscus triporus TaxID=2934178 RepID=A0ABD3MZ42_9STRA
MMNELNVAHRSLEIARDNIERDLNEIISALKQGKSGLVKRLNELNIKKHEIAEANGNLDAADNDLVEINAGGKVIVAKRSTLTQIQGTRLEALFSGRWDKKLLRDSHGRIFLDVNPTCFQAIVDYLSERMISSEDSPPSPPSVDDERAHILQCQLELFGLLDKVPTIDVDFSDSSIIRDAGHCTALYDWLKEDGSDGELSLLYRGSSDGLSGPAFHSKCDNMGCTLTIIETSCGKVIGGYSNTSWTSRGSYSAANKAFLFALSGGGISSPCKMKLKNVENQHAIWNHSNYGPTFGAGNDMKVRDSQVHIKLGHSYHTGPHAEGSYTINEMEVFQVTDSSPQARIATSAKRTSKAFKSAQDKSQTVEPFTSRFSDDINKAINANRECLVQAGSEMLQLEDSFEDEQTFIEKFASGDAKDVVALNVTGTIMVTKRSTLCTVEDSALAQQFDDSKWTEQGCNAPRVMEWTPDEVSTWAKSIHGLTEDVSVMLNYLLWVGMR